jgi:hypothetical protein
MRTGRLQLLLGRPGQIRQRGQRLLLLPAQRVGVAVHRQGNGAVPGQRLRRLGMNATGCQVADERVPQRVEVGHAAGVVPVRDTSCLQIGPQQSARPSTRNVEHRGGGVLRRQEWPQRVCDGRPQR